MGSGGFRRPRRCSPRRSSAGFRGARRPEGRSAGSGRFDSLLRMRLDLEECATGVISRSPSIASRCARHRCQGKGTNGDSTRIFAITCGGRGEADRAAIAVGSDKTSRLNLTPPRRRGGYPRPVPAVWAMAGSRPVGRVIKIPAGAGDGQPGSPPLKGEVGPEWAGGDLTSRSMSRRTSLSARSVHPHCTVSVPMVDVALGVTVSWCGRHPGRPERDHHSTRHAQPGSVDHAARSRNAAPAFQHAWRPARSRGGGGPESLPGHRTAARAKRVAATARCGREGPLDPRRRRRTVQPVATRDLHRALITARTWWRCCFTSTHRPTPVRWRS